MSFVFD
ncbi:hypothetical protein CP8484711_2336A, partial [Chlamydia psittaci 84-8471/1]